MPCRQSLVLAGPLPPWPFLADFDLLQCLFSEPHLCWRSRVGIASQRKTLAIDHHHALCSLSPFGLSTAAPLFFAGKKLASMNDSSQSSTPLASNSERKALHISFSASASYHSFRRRQHVEGCGKLSGRSFHRAPARVSTVFPQRPSDHRPLDGLPSADRPLGNEGLDPLPLFLRQIHDWSLTGLTSGEMHIPKYKETRAYFMRVSRVTLSAAASTSR